jgi:hypothetical protein
VLASGLHQLANKCEKIAGELAADAQPPSISTSGWQSSAAGALLNVGQKVLYQSATCGVGGDGLVACLDTSLGQHGFVLKPSGNVTF